MKAFAIAVLFFASCLFAAGQEQIPNTSGVAAPHSEKAQPRTTRPISSDSLAQAEADAETAANGAANSDVSNSRVSQARAAYDEAYWKYQRDAIEHTRKVYRWQHISSIIIFYVVIFLVLVGVVFSWLQFKAAAYKAESEELDASMQGVKITSSTLGVVILVLSMCFFYLYLRYVYPINVNEGTKMVTSSEKDAGH